MTVEELLSKARHRAPRPVPTLGTLVSAVCTGSLVLSSGHFALDGASVVTGRLGDDRTVDAGDRAAASRRGA